MTRRPAHRPGLTLIEVLLVVAVLIALGAVAYPTLSAMYGDVKVKAAADDVRAAWADARSRAIEDGRAYRFSVQPGTGKFRVAPDADGFWDGSGGEAGEGEAPPFIHEGDLPNGIHFQIDDNLPADGGGEWTTVVVFNPDGGTTSDVEIELQEDDNVPLIVKVRAMTGAVSVRKKSAQDR